MRFHVVREWAEHRGFRILDMTTMTLQRKVYTQEVNARARITKLTGTPKLDALLAEIAKKRDAYRRGVPTLGPSSTDHTVANALESLLRWFEAQ